MVLEGCAYEVESKSEKGMREYAKVWESMEADPKSTFNKLRLNFSPRLTEPNWEDYTVTQLAQISNRIFNFLTPKRIAKYLP